MSTPTIKTPLTFGDAVEMATNHCSSAGRLTHDEAKCKWCATLAGAFIAVDVASRTQARDDIASGQSPLPLVPPIAERGCNGAGCRNKPAWLEVAAPALGCARWFCSVACLRANDLEDAAKRWQEAQEPVCRTCGADRLGCECPTFDMVAR